MTDDCRADDPRLSPMLYKVFNDQPPCMLVVAECDPYYDECLGNCVRSLQFNPRANVCCLAYGKRLENAGVRVEVVVLRGLIHSFFSYPGQSYHVLRVQSRFILYCM